MTDDAEFAYFAGRREGAFAERNRILRALEQLHRDLGQIAHIESPSTVCKTCRAVTIVLNISEVDSKPTETETPCQCKKQP